MQNRRFFRRVGCAIAALSLTAAGCTVSSSRDWAQTAPTIAPTSVSIEQVHLGGWSDGAVRGEVKG